MIIKNGLEWADVPFICLGLCMVGVLISIPFVVHQENEWKEACIQSGGVYIPQRDRSLCLDPAAVKEVKIKGH